MEIKAVSTTVSVQVQGGDGHLSAEIDSRTWGFNGGRTQYFPGDTCYVLVYKSKNVENLTGITNMTGVGFTRQSSTDNGYNVHREGISFTTPVASSSKPVGKMDSSTTTYVPVGAAGGAEYFKDTTIFRCSQWKVTGKMEPGVPPPYAFSFIEYTPTTELWALTPLKRNNELFSTTINGILYGKATPTEVDKGTPLT